MSPWHKPGRGPGSGGEDPNEPTTRPLGLGKAILVALGTAALVMGVGIWWMQRQRQVRAISVPPTAAATATASVPARATARPVLAATEAPVATGEPTAAATAEPTAEPVAEPPGAAVDPASLPATLGAVQVSFNGEGGAELYAQGKRIGPITETLRVACGQPLFLRLGKQIPGNAYPRWVSEPKTVNVKCQALTALTFQPR